MPFVPHYSVPTERLPYTLTAGNVGVLVLHGFMGSPYSSRPMAEYLHHRGITVHCPLLPGHGHYPDKFHRVSHQAWLQEADEGLGEMRRLSDQIFLMGHSMGSVLAAYLLQNNPDVRGVAMIAPIYELPDSRVRLVKYVRHLMPWFHPEWVKSMRRTVKDRVLDFDPHFDFDAPNAAEKVREMTRLPTSGLTELVKIVDLGKKLWGKVNVPALLLDAGHDIAIHPDSAKSIYQQLPHPDKQHHHFPRATHELMRPKDPAHTQVWQLVHQFIHAHTLS